MLHTEVFPGVLGLWREEGGTHKMLRAKNIHGSQGMWQRSSIWCPVPWPRCVTVAANKLGFGLNIFETTPSLTLFNCLKLTP